MSAATLEILRPFVTPEITQLVGNRLLRGLKFFDGESGKILFDRGDVKLALLLIREANSTELFTAEEKKILEGGQRKDSKPPRRRNK